MVNLAYNLVARLNRSAGSMDAMLDSLKASGRSSPDRFAEKAELEEIIRAAIDRLSFHHRAVVILFYLGDFSLEEIAYILDCPVGTVKSRLHYARNKLRSQLIDVTGFASEVMYELAQSAA